MRICYLIQARTGSSRYPGKVLDKIDGRCTLFEYVYRRVLTARDANRDNVFVLTTDQAPDDPLVELMNSNNISYFRGDEGNVFKRFADFLAQSKEAYDYYLRICSDNPFIEPSFLDRLVEKAQVLLDNCPDYLSYHDHRGRPAIITHYGLFGEMIRTEAMTRAEKIIDSDQQKEHVTPVFYQSGLFSVCYLPMPEALRDKPYRFTIDTPEDARLVKEIIGRLGKKDISYKDLVRVTESDPGLMARMSENLNRNPKEPKS